MRKLKFKNWIPGEIEDRYKPSSLLMEKVKEGTGCFEKEFIQDGTFLSWGVDCDYHGNGGGSHTVAIIELPNGEVTTALPENIKFVESKQDQENEYNCKNCGDTGRYEPTLENPDGEICNCDENQMPSELTVENGAKDLLNGVFFEEIYIYNPEYDADMDCSDSEYHTQKVPVSWDTIKEIYKTIVKHYTNENNSN